MLSQINPNPTIAVRDLNVARDFYEKKLGLQPVNEEKNDFVQFYKAGESAIEIYQSEFAGSNKATALTWRAGDNFEQEIQNLKNKGVSFEHYNMPETKLEGDIHVMKGMRAAWFKDPDGNILCVHDY